MKIAKKISLSASWQEKNSALLKFLFWIFIIFILFFALNFFSPQIRNLAYKFSNPIKKRFWSAGQSMSNLSASILRAGALSKENENLRKENQKLLSQINLLQAIKIGNEAQIIISASCQNDEFDLVMVGVSGLNVDGEVTINKGADDGIEAGMPVIDQEKVIFGKVSQVYKNFSKVMLITNENSVVNVKVLNIYDDETESVYGVVKGIGGLTVILDLVPVNDKLEQGDVLVTSALEGTFPKNLLIGKVSKVNKNDQSPHQQANVDLFLDIGTENLFVITNHKR